MKHIIRLILPMVAIATIVSLAPPTTYADAAPPGVATDAVVASESQPAPAAIYTVSNIDADIPDAALIADAPAALTWQQGLIPILTPFIVAGLRFLVPKVPKAFLPIAAGALGMLGDWIAHLTTGSELNIWLGLGLGLAGVGLREASKQLKAATLPAIATQP